MLPLLRGVARETRDAGKHMKLTIRSSVWVALSLAIGVMAGEPSTVKPKARKAAAAGPGGRAHIATVARSPYLGAIAVDATTGKVLVQDQADAVGYPASMLKLMDLLVVLEKVEQHQLSFQDQVTVSAKASRTGGSRVWLKEKEVFSVDDLLYALMIQSANDSAVALAEKVAGSTEGFVELMNQKAKALGMNQTVFHSVHGLPPGTGQLPDTTTPRDFTILCRELLKHTDTLRYTSARERPFRPETSSARVIMRNHNHLLGQVPGCDGFKTGYFTAAGYSEAITAARGNQRVIVVVLGSVDRKVRDAKAAEIVARAFAASPAPTAAVAPVTAPAPARPTTPAAAAK